ncbi:MAG: hypothetical protein ACK5ZJ_12430, partial [Acidobacteriota bacterium]
PLPRIELVRPRCFFIEKWAGRVGIEGKILSEVVWGLQRGRVQRKGMAIEPLLLGPVLERTRGVSRLPLKCFSFDGGERKGLAECFGYTSPY